MCNLIFLFVVLCFSFVSLFPVMMLWCSIAIPAAIAMLMVSVLVTKAEWMICGVFAPKNRSKRNERGYNLDEPSSFLFFCWSIDSTRQSIKKHKLNNWRKTESPNRTERTKIEIKIERRKITRKRTFKSSWCCSVLCSWCVFFACVPYIRFKCYQNGKSVFETVVSMYENACYFLQRRTTTGYDFTIHNFMVSTLNIKKWSSSGSDGSNSANNNTEHWHRATKHDVQLYIHAQRAL